MSPTGKRVSDTPHTSAQKYALLGLRRSLRVALECTSLLFREGPRNNYSQNIWNSTYRSRVGFALARREVPRSGCDLQRAGAGITLVTETW